MSDRNAILEEVRLAMVSRSNTYSASILSLDVVIYEIERLKTQRPHTGLGEVRG